MYSLSFGKLEPPVFPGLLAVLVLFAPFWPICQNIENFVRISQKIPVKISTETPKNFRISDSFIIALVASYLIFN
jgi:hypothetical protein